MANITKEDINSFLSGTDPMEHIIKIECDYDSNKVYIIYRDNKGNKKIKIDWYYPFVWSKAQTAKLLFNGDKNKLKAEMTRYGIQARALSIKGENGNIPERMKNGFNVLFQASVPMDYRKFLTFFSIAGKPIFSHNEELQPIKEYISVSPVEQYMISTGKRLFKGYNDYNDLVRMQWDLETEGLDPHICAISQIGIRTNKGFEKIIKIEGTGNEKLKNEILAIKEFLVIINTIKPDIISGHNTENFDWNFIDVRLSLYGSSLKAFSQNILPRGVYKKKQETVLKLGGEMEYYYPTIMWGYNLTDSLFAVRRAQALDSNMKKADLKYITKYSKLAKPNRVYVPGKIINKIWSDQTLTYAFNNNNGKWFKITDELLGKTYIDNNNEEKIKYSKINNSIIDNQNNETFEIVSGRYIVERYLLDDLYESDLVEARFNQSNYLIGQLLPVNYEKVCTMGTAAIWKYIMLAWSYEHKLAIPDLIQSHSFTGGLSRLLKVGFVDNVVKLDYNSLYPSIILSFNIRSSTDIQGIMNTLLEYILSQREYYKKLKSEESKKANNIRKQIEDNSNCTNVDELKKEQLQHEALSARYDKMQLPLKIIGNGFFGSYGSGSIFPWSDLECAEETTCTGRMMLRMMIKHFKNLGYEPIVGDSFTNDTPIFIKYNVSSLIDIVPIYNIFNAASSKKDAFGREYDTETKDFKVLCKSGWQTPLYVYRHKTDKDIYQIISIEHNMTSEITEDHSLYDNKHQKLKPSEINHNTKLDFYNFDISSNIFDMTHEIGALINDLRHNNMLQKLPIKWINADIKSKKIFLERINSVIIKNPTKTLIAGIIYIKNCIKSHDSNV